MRDAKLLEIGGGTKLINGIASRKATLSPRDFTSLFLLAMTPRYCKEMLETLH